MCATPSSLERNVKALRWTSLCSPCRWRRDFALSTRRQQTLFEVRTKAPCDWGSSRRTREPIVTPRFCPFFLLQKRQVGLQARCNKAIWIKTNGSAKKSLRFCSVTKNRTLGHIFCALGLCCFDDERSDENEVAQVALCLLH